MRTKLCKCSWYRALSVDIHPQVKIKYFSSDRVIGKITQCFLVFSGLVLILLEPSHHFHYLEINAFLFYTLGYKSLRELSFSYRQEGPSVCDGQLAFFSGPTPFACVKVFSCPLCPWQEILVPPGLPFI